MEAIEGVVIVACTAIAAPFLVGFWVRISQSIFSTKAQQAAVEDTNDTTKQ